MGLVRKVASWMLGFALAVTLVVAVLHLTGSLAATYGWLVRYVAPEVWSAIAAWVAVAVGIATVIVAGSYAKQQVEKAQDQVGEAQAARLAQEKQSQEALATQIKLASEAISAQAEMNQQTLKHDAEQAQKIRREQAQPNVVIYTELNPTVKQYIEIVVKNFGATPAYNVTIDIDPILKSTPNSLSGSKLYEIPIPIFPILAPGQEWRTNWDHSPTRKNYQKKWEKFTGKAESELSEQQRLEVHFLQTHTYEGASVSEVIEAMSLPSRHTAKVSYLDSDAQSHRTEAVLDSELFKGTTWVDIKTVHNLNKLLEKQLAEQAKALDAISRRLAEFGSEHEGVWVYISSDDEERQYRRSVEAVQEIESRESSDRFNWQLSGRQGDDPQQRIDVDNAVEIPIEDAKILDWYLPNSNGPVEAWKAWRIAFVKRHFVKDFGRVYELFRSDGTSVREREGTLISCIRRPT